MLALESVQVMYRGAARRALDGVTLTIAAGECTVLLGPSGSGKSTLLRCMNLLTAPTTGRIVAGDLGPIGRGIVRRHRQRTGIVFQGHQLLPRATALANVLTARLAHRSTLASLLPARADDVRLALACLRRVGLADHALVRADRLSGGERQRVGIARALAQEPRLLLADEPVASLDPATAVAVLELIRRICVEDGIAVVVSLHQPDLARRFADRVIGLREGAVAFDASPADLDEAMLAALYRRGAEPVPEPEPIGADR